MADLQNLDKIIDHIRVMESDKKNLAGFLRNCPDILRKIESYEIGDLVVAGEDGGITKKSTHLMDFVFLRAVSAIFKYSGGALNSVEYFPSQNPPAEVMHTTEPLSDIEFRMFWSLRRVIKELEVSIQTIEKFSPEVFLIDGSLMIHPADVPRKESTLFEDYLRVKQRVSELHEICKAKNCLLAGVVEDSRSSIFCGYVEKEIFSQIESEKLSELKRVLDRVRDSNILYYLLEKGEATCELDCGDGIKGFYLKTAEFDRPIRVEYLEGGEKLAGIVYSLSCQSRTYGLPNVLIEADQRAKLSESDSLFYMNHISSRLGLQDLFFLRRENRPF